jgi:hypothetical protein
MTDNYTAYGMQHTSVLILVNTFTNVTHLSIKDRKAERQEKGKIKT